MKKYKVIREHIGDKPYHAGDVRHADPNDVAHLVKNGVLALEVETKPEPVVLDKAKRAPRSKRGKK